MITLIILISIISVLSTVAIIYLANLHNGRIKDVDKDFIPDVVEERAKRVKEEVGDIVQDLANAIDGIDDVVDAAKGSKRKGRPKNSKDGN
jgi:hypothetical protein